MALLLMPTQIIAISLCTIILHSHKSIELLPCSISIHKTSNNVDDDCYSKNPIPKGTSWHLFSFFLNFIHEFPYMCVCFGPIYPKNVVFEGPKKSFIRNYIDCKSFQKRRDTFYRKVGTPKTPLEQSYLILSIYFSFCGLQSIVFNKHTCCVYTDIYEIIGDKGNFICRQ